MRKILLGLFILGPALAFAQAPVSNSQAPQFPTDSPSFSQVSLPPVPRFDWEGNSIKADPAMGLPQNGRIEELSNNTAELIKMSENEDLPSHLFWHQGDQGPYCHYVDFQGNDWYGWQEDTKFQWVLAYQGALWVQEPMDGRWLCFSQSNWWWKGDDENGPWSLYRDGTYYLCDAKGKITDAKGERPGELKSDYDGPFKGDFMSRQVFYHGTNGSHGGLRAGGHGPWAGHPGPGRVYTSQTVAWTGH